MATIISKGGKKITLLNPSEKGEKYAKEMKKGRKIRNDGSYALDGKKKSIPLTKTQRAYRAGYLDARNDNARCFKSRQAKSNRRG
ncbi:MAG: hypothetical protein J6C79_01410 [Clostridia bacterium]|nr:hypothetical protein [Clostridia bacterium]